MLQTFKYYVSSLKNLNISPYTCNFSAWANWWNGIHRDQQNAWKEKGRTLYCQWKKNTDSNTPKSNRMHVIHAFISATTTQSLHWFLLSRAFDANFMKSLLFTHFIHYTFFPVRRHRNFLHLEIERAFIDLPIAFFPHLSLRLCVSLAISLPTAS